LSFGDHLSVKHDKAAAVRIEKYTFDLEIPIVIQFLGTVKVIDAYEFRLINPFFLLIFTAKMC